MIYELIMGNGGPICRMIGSGDCDNCKAKQVKMYIMPYKGLNRKIYKKVSKC